MPIELKPADLVDLRVGSRMGTGAIPQGPTAGAGRTLIPSEGFFPLIQDQQPLEPLDPQPLEPLDPEPLLDPQPLDLSGRVRVPQLYPQLYPGLLQEYVPIAGALLLYVRL